MQERRTKLVSISEAIISYSGWRKSSKRWVTYEKNAHGLGSGNCTAEEKGFNVIFLELRYEL